MQLTIKCILNHKTDVSINTFCKVATSLSEICSSERQSPNREMIKYWVKMDEMKLGFPFEGCFDELAQRESSYMHLEVTHELIFSRITSSWYPSWTHLGSSQRRRTGKIDVKIEYLAKRTKAPVAFIFHTDVFACLVQQGKSSLNHKKSCLKNHRRT